MSGSPAHTAEGYAAAIRERWQASLEAILEVGRLLIEAKAALEYGDFTEMVEELLPFSSRTAQRLMSIANHPRLADATHASVLPPSWYTLYELTRLDDDQFEAAVAAGEIRPDMARTDAERLRRRNNHAARLARAEERAGRAEPLPALGAQARRWPVLYVDPPWRFKTWSDTGRQKAPDNHYTTMTLDALRALPVGDLAAADAALWLWATVGHMGDALGLMAAWGFTYRSHVVWAKTYDNGQPRRGTGYWFINTHELLLLGTRGNMPSPVPGTQAESVISAPVGRHSEKPEIFAELIERYFPGVSRLELFARTARPGWDAWGDEVINRDDGAAA